MLINITRVWGKLLLQGGEIFTEYRDLVYLMIILFKK